jgi:hypothetical protein
MRLERGIDLAVKRLKNTQKGRRVVGGRIWRAMTNRLFEILDGFFFLG